MKKTVLRNVIRLKQEWPSNPKLGENFPILLNLKTGDIELKNQGLDHVGSDDGWKELFLSVRLDRDHKNVHFDVTEKDGHELSKEQINRLILQIVNETLSTLNELAHDFVPEAKQIRKKPPSIKKTMSRLEAEKLFKDQRVGTYQISETSPQLSDVAFRMSESNKMAIGAYVLTIMEEEGLNQHILIESDLGWTILTDNPDLHSPVYKHFANLPLLLQSLPPKRKFLLED